MREVSVKIYIEQREFLVPVYPEKGVSISHSQSQEILHNQHTFKIGFNAYHSGRSVVFRKAAGGQAVQFTKPANSDYEEMGNALSAMPHIPRNAVFVLCEPER